MLHFLSDGADSHFLNERGVGVGEDIPLLSPQRAAGDVEVDPQVRVVAFYGHTDVLRRRGRVSRRGRRDGNRQKDGGRLAAAYLDGGDVEWRGDAKHGHDDGLVLLVDEDLHFSDVLFSRHLRHVLIGHVGFSGPGEEKRNSINRKMIYPHIVSY